MNHLFALFVKFALTVMGSVYLVVTNACTSFKIDAVQSIPNIISGIVSSVAIVFIFFAKYFTFASVYGLYAGLFIFGTVSTLRSVIKHFLLKTRLPGVTAFDYGIPTNYLFTMTSDAMGPYKQHTDVRLTLGNRTNAYYLMNGFTAFPMMDADVNRGLIVDHVIFVVIVGICALLFDIADRFLMKYIDFNVFFLITFSLFTSVRCVYPKADHKLYFLYVFLMLIPGAIATFVYFKTYKKYGIPKMIVEGVAVTIFCLLESTYLVYLVMLITGKYNEKCCLMMKLAACELTDEQSSELKGPFIAVMLVWIAGLVIYFAQRWFFQKKNDEETSE